MILGLKKNNSPTDAHIYLQVAMVKKTLLIAPIVWLNAILAYSASVNCKVLVIIIFKYKVLNDHHNIVSWEFANKSTIAQHSVPLCL